MDEQKQIQNPKPDHVITHDHAQALVDYLVQRPYREVAELIRLTASLPTIDQYLQALVARQSRQDNGKDEELTAKVTNSKEVVKNPSATPQPRRNR